MPSPSAPIVTNTTGTIANAARTATSVSRMQIITALRSRFSFFGTYDPYVTIMPIPTDSEKKACPRAATSVSPLMASGRISNRYLTPSQAPGSVTARNTIAIRSKNKHGIRNLLNFSIPLETPRTTTKMHKPKNNAPQIKGSTGALINCTKKS